SSSSLSMRSMNARNWPAATTWDAASPVSSGVKASMVSVSRFATTFNAALTALSGTSPLSTPPALMRMVVSLDIASLAFCFDGAGGHRPPLLVLAVGDHFEMVRVNASTLAAEMIYLLVAGHVAV